MSKVFLIDPFACTVTEHDIDLQGLDEVYALMQCQYVEAVRLLGTTDWLYLDEDGRYKENQRYFACCLFPGQILCGRAVWFGGPDDEGEAIGAASTLQFICDQIIFQQNEDENGND
jgi:hypothetical protein